MMTNITEYQSHIPSRKTVSEVRAALIIPGSLHTDVKLTQERRSVPNHCRLILLKTVFRRAGRRCSRVRATLKESEGCRKCPSGDQAHLNRSLKRKESCSQSAIPRRTLSNS
jgi:hypothetical protein